MPTAVSHQDSSKLSSYIGPIQEGDTLKNNSLNSSNSHPSVQRYHMLVTHRKWWFDSASGGIHTD